MAEGGGQKPRLTGEGAVPEARVAGHRSRGDDGNGGRGAVRKHLSGRKA